MIANMYVLFELKKKQCAKSDVNKWAHIIPNSLDFRKGYGGNSICYIFDCNI